MESELAGTVVCAIDVNDYSSHHLEMAASLAKAHGVPLDLLHVTVAPEPVHQPWPAYFGSSSQLICDNRKLTRIQSPLPGLRLRHHHLTGLPVQQILDFAARNRPLMLVLGTHGRRGIARLLALGSVATAVLRQAECPVMICKCPPESFVDSAAGDEAGADRASIPVPGSGAAAHDPHSH